MERQRAMNGSVSIPGYSNQATLIGQRQVGLVLDFWLVS